MSRIDTLTSKEQAVEEVPQEMLVIGALHLPTESDGVDTVAAPEREKRRDWNEIVTTLFYTTELVLDRNYLLEDHDNLVMSEITDAQEKKGWVSFTISAANLPDVTLLTVYIPKESASELRWTRGKSELLRELIGEKLQYIIDEGFLPSPLEFSI